MNYSGNLKASMTTSFAFEPQDYPTECNAIEKLIKTTQDLIAANDIKIVLANFIIKFLTQLDSVIAILKSKSCPQLGNEYFKQLIRRMIEDEGIKLFDILKEVILVRQRDRSLREFSLRAVKRLLRIAG